MIHTLKVLVIGMAIGAVGEAVIYELRNRIRAWVVSKLTGKK